MRTILFLLVLVSVLAIPSFAEAGKTQKLLKKMTKPPCELKAKMAKCLHPCKSQ